MGLFVPVKDLPLCSQGFFLKLLRATVIFGVGWLIAKLIKEAITNISAVKYFLNLFYPSSKRLKKQELLTKSALKHAIFEIIGIVIYWLIVLGAFILSLNYLL